VSSTRRRTTVARQLQPNWRHSRQEVSGETGAVQLNKWYRFWRQATLKPESTRLLASLIQSTGAKQRNELSPALISQFFSYLSNTLLYTADSLIASATNLCPASFQCASERNSNLTPSALYFSTNLGCMSITANSFFAATSIK